LVAIAKQHKHLSRSLWEILQVVSVSAMEQVSLEELLMNIYTSDEHVYIPKQLEINYS
jgi:hypothetical protein